MDENSEFSVTRFRLRKGSLVFEILACSSQTCNKKLIIYFGSWRHFQSNNFAFFCLGQLSREKGFQFFLLTYVVIVLVETSREDSQAMA